VYGSIKAYLWKNLCFSGYFWAVFCLPWYWWWGWWNWTIYRL